jgi:hypothetical protein
MQRGTWANDPRVRLRATPGGAIKVGVLEELGMPRPTVYRRCAEGGPWQKLLPGVVLLCGTPPTRRQLVEAALLYAGPDAVVTGAEACHRFSLRAAPKDEHVHLLVPHDRKVHSSDYVIIERTRRLPEPVVRDGVPLAPMARAVLDACRRLRSHEPVSALLTEAVQRGRLQPAHALSELEHGSPRGTAVPRAVLRDVLAGARSVAEIDAIRVWKRTDLPEPQRNVRLYGRRGEYVATPDGWFDDVGLAWEIDSFAFHFSRDDYAKTLARNSRYAAAGIPVVQTLPTKLRDEPEAVAAELTAAYQAAASRPRPPVRTEAAA